MENIKLHYKPLINKLLLTFFILFFYKLCSYFPLPGINLTVIENFFSDKQNSMFGLANLFSGGAIERMSFVALGVMPYITAAILMEVWAHFDKDLGSLKKEKDGMVKFTQKTRYLTLLIASFQAIGVSYGITKMGEGVLLVDITTFMIYSIPMLVMGTMLLMWLGEQISSYGIGNGISLIIFTAIVSGLPSGFINTLELFQNGSLNFLILVLLLLIILFTAIFIIFIEKAERRIPLQYTTSEAQGNFFPIKINLTNVIPAIFASALISVPATFAVFINENSALQIINDILTPNSISFNVLTFILIFGFTFFYSKIAFKTEEITKNLNLSGAYIPGIRPGEKTKDYLDKIALHLTTFSGIYLGFIATVPWFIMNKLGAPFYFGGIITLVVIQVIFDFVNKLMKELNNAQQKKFEDNSFI